MIGDGRAGAASEMSRATTWIAVAAGALFGGALGWPSPEPPQAETTTTRAAEPAVSTHEPAAQAQEAAPEPNAAASAAAPPGVPGPDSPLASPHSRPVKTEAELRAAEVNCDAKVAADCIRAADGYERGVVPRDEERISRHRKVALTLYMRQYSTDPVACYQLSRLYAEGDIVEKNVANAKALLKRAGERCETVDTPACVEIRQLAGP
jgi:TPR repeat protein